MKPIDKTRSEDSTSSEKTKGDSMISSYGVLEQSHAATSLDSAAEEIACVGYSVVESGYTPEEIVDIGRAFDAVHGRFIDRYKEDFLKEIDEYDGIRLPLAFDEKFVELAMNQRVMELVERNIRNKFVLNQQNGIINPPKQVYTQGMWHRDLPYQHFVSSRPLAVSALYCVDDFTAENGATFVLPASHGWEKCPSDSFMESKAQQITAPAGAFIVFNSMLFHRGGANRTSSRRRAVNHVYTCAFIKQQIDIPCALGDQPIRSEEAAELLGYRYKIPRTVADYLEVRRKATARATP